MSKSSLKTRERELKEALVKIEGEWGGDVRFFPPVRDAILKDYELKCQYKIPGILKYFYTKESNGVIIDNKRVYGFFDSLKKQTFVDNIERVNDPNSSPWFKNKPEIFNDYFVIAADGPLVFCLSKRYDLENPGIYIAKNPNSSKGVTLTLLGLDLFSLIQQMVQEAYNK